MSNIDLNSLDRLLFLNNRYFGKCNGDIDLSRRKSKYLAIANLSIDNFRFDDLQYSKAILRGTMNDYEITVNEFSAKNNSSSFDLFGTIDLHDSFKLSKITKIDLFGSISNLNLSLLNHPQ